MSKLHPESWSVTNKTDFDIVLIDVTPNLKKPKLSDYNVEKLSFLAEGAIKPGETSLISMKKFEHSFYREVIMARAGDAFPVKKIAPQFQMGSNNLIPCVVTMEDFEHSQSVINSIKDYYAGKITALTTDLNLVINKTYDKNNFSEIRKEVNEFLKEHYKDYDPGPIQYLDNLHLVESYLNTFPDHWILSNNSDDLQKTSKLFVYYAADLELTDANKTIPSLSCAGTVNIVDSKKQICDLNKGNNNGYQIKLDITGKGSSTLSYHNGAFTYKTDDNVKVTLKPVIMQRGVVYSGVKLKHVAEKASDDDLIILLVGTVLDEIVIAIPDEIDLNKQNSGNVNNTPLAPSVKHKNIAMAILGAVIFSMTVLMCFVARKRFAKMRILAPVIENVTDRDGGAQHEIFSIQAAVSNEPETNLSQDFIDKLVNNTPVPDAKKIVELISVNTELTGELSNPKYSLDEDEYDTISIEDEEIDNSQAINNTLAAGLENDLASDILANLNDKDIRSESFTRRNRVDSAVKLDSELNTQSIVVDDFIKEASAFNSGEALNNLTELQQKLKKIAEERKELFDKYKELKQPKIRKTLDDLRRELKDAGVDMSENLEKLKGEVSNAQPEKVEVLTPIADNIQRKLNDIAASAEKSTEESNKINELDQIIRD